MKSQRFVFILICFFFISVLTQFSVYAKDEWYQIKTKNFTLIGNAKEKKIIKVGIKLEQFRESIKRLVPTLSKNSPIQTTVVVFKDEKSFRPFKPINKNGEIADWVAGYFQAGFDVNYIVLKLNKKNAVTYQTIFHEYTHDLINYNIGRKNLPVWIGEGLAEYYDQFSVKKDHIVSIGKRNQSHIKLLKENGLIPLNQFFETDYSTLASKSKMEASRFYSQAWLLTHFLIHGENGVRKSQFDKFIKLVVRKRDVKQSFEDSFDMSYLELLEKLKFHIDSSVISETTTRFESNLSEDVQIEKKILNVDKRYAIFGDLLYQSKKFNEAETYLQKALKLNPYSSFANSTFGMLRFRQEKYQEAKEFLNNALKSNETDYLTYYRNAFFLSQEVISFGDYISNYSNERAYEMRESLNKSILLNPLFSDSYRLLGFINLVRKENIDTGIKLMQKAIEISPQNQSYLIELAQLYKLKKDHTNAKLIIKKVIKNTIDKEFHSRATDILEQIEFIEQASKAEKTNKFKEKKTQSIKKSKALTELDLERNRRQTENEKITEVLRKPKVGEKRIVGKISKVECINNQVFLNVTTNSETKTLKSSSLDNIKLKTFTSEMRNGFLGCHLDKIGIVAVFTYKPFVSNLENLLGAVISIEFVPNNFVLKP